MIVVQGADGANLFVDGQLINQTTSPRTFVSPELVPGKDYYYTFKTERIRDGKPVADSKRVYVRAGQTARISFDAPATAGTAQPASARVTVQLPQDARLTIDGIACPLTTATRTFETPQLDPGRKYYYTLRAEVVRDGKPRADSQRVIVEAGKNVQVDFRGLPPVQTASR